MKKIISFDGSNTSNSINRQLLRAVSARLAHFWVEEKSLLTLKIPMYGIDEEASNGIPDAILELHKELGTADAFIIASPEHNGMVTAFFKNVIDWLSRADMNIFRGKPIFLISTSPGQNGGRSGLELLKNLMPRWGAGPICMYSLGNFFTNFDPKRQRVTDLRADHALTSALERFELNLGSGELQKINHNNYINNK